MSKIGEAQITRLTRERLAAIKKFLPVRDSFRDNLQAKQQAKMGYTEETRELFKPITEVTKEVGEKTQQYLKTLPKDIADAQFANILDVPPPPPDPTIVVEKVPKKKVIPLKDKFNDNFVQSVTNEGDFGGLIRIAAESYNDRRKLLKPKSYVTMGNIEDWAEVVYKINTGTSRAQEKDKNLANFKMAVREQYRFLEQKKLEKEIEQGERLRELGSALDKRGEVLKQKEEQLKQQQQTSKPKKRGRPPKTRTKEELEAQIQKEQKKIKKLQQKSQGSIFGQLDPEPQEGATGEGYRGGNVKVKNSRFIPCSRTILDDVSRLEVLIGGRRAGNNSPEIINEATEICQRLFQGKVIGMGLYRNLVNELIDTDYYSD